ncbi:MAG: FMN-binding protein [Candidatus Latescibacteria bacterium]|nr:FMN-binding protein [Candidatus Latescibacterota bacterium]MCK5733243.1 FMN-binding protein [Candidatus Latescibacterota bacterium]
MKEKIKLIVFVVVLGSILTTALVAVDDYTAPIIEANMLIKTRMSVLEALNIPYTTEAVNETFTRYVQTEVKQGKAFYVSNTGAIAFEFSGSALWGPLHGVVALLADLETIQGLIIIQQEETPGLGGRIADKEFLDLFKEKSIVPMLKILAPGKANAVNEVDGITGATLSCNALAEILNSQLGKYIPLVREGE